MLISEMNHSPFDTFYIPEEMPFRDTEVANIQDVYGCTAEENRGFVCLVHGPQEMGRTLFPRYFMTTKVPNDHPFTGFYVDADNLNYQFINGLGFNEGRIECRMSKWHEIFSTALLKQTINKMLAKDSQSRFIVTLDNLTQDSTSLLKLCSELTSYRNIFLIGVLNSSDFSTITRGKSRIPWDMDIYLRSYEKREVYRIISDRLAAKTGKKLDSKCFKYIVDVSFQWHTGTASVCMNSLNTFVNRIQRRQPDSLADAVRKSLEHLVPSGHDTSYSKELAFEGFSSRDLLVLQCVSEYFSRTDELYLDENLLIENSLIKSEELGVGFDKRGILSSIRLLNSYGIIFWSDCQESYFISDQSSSFSSSVRHELLGRKDPKLARAYRIGLIR